MSSKKKNTDVLISIIMPCYNAYSFLDKSIESLANQKSDIIRNKQLELIIVDDDSDDGKTIDKCKELTNKYDFIKLIKLQENLGQGYARNEGVKKAIGTYIGFMDADDELDTNYLNAIEKNLNEFSNFDMYVWGLTELHYDSKNSMVEKIEILPEDNQNQSIPKSSLDLEKKTLFGYLWNKLYKSEIIKQNNISFKNRNLIEDYLFNLDFVKHASSICCINQSLYNYNRRLNEKNSVTSKFDREYFQQHYERVQSMYDYLKQNNALNNEAKVTLANIYVRYSLSAVWRNKSSQSQMNKLEQKKWLDDYFNLPLSKELLKYVKPNGLLAKVNAFLFKGNHKKLIMLEASFVSIASKHMDKTLIKARQSR